MSNLYPWQDSLWRHVSRLVTAGTLPHAMLLTGPQGLGKLSFSAYLAASLFCKSGQEGRGPCGRCKGCELLRAGNHPDLMVVQPLEDRKSIGIDQIRALSDFIALMPQEGAWKICVIAEAEKMTLNAANSLLKNLEEPTKTTLIVLLTAQPSRLLATIRSRCQVLKFRPPSLHEAMTWLREEAGIRDDAQARLLLALSHGAPLRSVQMHETGVLTERVEAMTDYFSLLSGKTDPIRMAEKWVKKEKLLITWIESWSADAIKAAMGASEAALANPDLSDRLLSATKSVDLLELYAVFDKATAAAKRLETSVNPQFLLEDLLVSCQTGAQGSRAVFHG